MTKFNMSAIMHIVNIHEAKTHLSELIKQVTEGESVIIAKAGKPLVKMVRLEAPEPHELSRLGFMKNNIQVPDDFNTMGDEDIETLFDGHSE
jgi:prevent-host-death family protein